MRVSRLQPWFHGKITRNASEYLLEKDKLAGSFIVRESQSQPGSFVDVRLCFHRATDHLGGA
jgi:hypothetical protein